MLLDLEHRTAGVVDHTDGGRISGLDWSACGRWLAYSRPEPGGRSGARIRIYDTRSSDIIDVTDGRYTDLSPSFDPEGDHLYFLSHREFDPVYDARYFDLNFPKGMRPYLGHPAWAPAVKSHA